MRKILTAEIQDNVYYSFACRVLLPEGQKGHHWETRGTNDLLKIDQNIFNESKASRKKVAMTCIDYKKSQSYGPSKLYKRMSENI